MEYEQKQKQKHEMANEKGQTRDEGSTHTHKKHTVNSLLSNDDFHRRV